MSSEHPAPVRHGRILALACLAQFMVVLDVSIVNVALPSIRSDLHFSASGLQWVVNAYVLTFAGFLLLGGRAADLFGRRRIFVLGLGLFSLSSLAGGLADSSNMLTAARAAQGLGGAILSPATLTIIMTTFDEGAARNRALGTWSSVAGAGGAAGGILGGVLTNYLSWRWVLFVNVPIGAVAIAAGLAYLTEGRRPTEARSLDVAGAITVTAGLAALVYAIVDTATVPWGSVRTLGVLGVAVVLLGAFAVIQMRSAAPLVPLGLFRSRTLAAANVVMLLTGAIFFSFWYFLSLYMQSVLGYGPLKAGGAFLPMAVCIILGAQISSRVMGHAGARPILVVGIVMSAGGFFWMGHLGLHSHYPSGILVPGILVSVGVGLCFTPLAAVATSGVHYTQAGLASGLLNTSRQVGGSIGLAALATLAADRTDALVRGGAAVTLVHGAQPAVVGRALTSGYDRAFLVGSLVSLLAAAVGLTIPDIRRRNPAAEPARIAVGAPTPVGVME
ncbi:MAG TPA: MFS transporter [Acidimicrobiales bacterium]|nr:MFS transporter [Acidimicrobiales bacterium]